MTTTSAVRAVKKAAEIEVRSPFDNRLVGEIPETPVEDIPAIAERAGRAAQAFRRSMPAERRQLLNALADEINNEASTLATLISDEMGKTITEARNEVRRAQNTLRLSGDAATFLDGEVLHCGILPGGVDRQASITYAPVGVVGAITPFNYPLNLLCHKLGPAIGAGNAVVAKPSPKAPLTAARLCQLAAKAGFPADLFQMVQGGADQAVALARSNVDLLSFTGGPEAGLALKQASGLIRCLMELGGNDPLFVMPDGDLDKAVATVISHRFEIAGQSCAAVKKLYLHEDIKDQFVERLLQAVSAVVTGDPASASTIMGPVIDANAAQVVCNRINQAVSLGGRILKGGKRDGNIIEPTVIDNAHPDMDLFATETFGPVIAVRTFQTAEKAIAEVNATPFGLQAGVFSNDHQILKQFARDLVVGGIMINEGPDFRAEHVPFGGVKKSGLGREGVRITLREMSETRVVID